ncbi:MAG TPA: glycosyltransferase [Candidatus Nanoarchaeia archaeon]|nr:glycosyltransferase [Candidatus Nanoarchaeia archaeon]
MPLFSIIIPAHNEEKYLQSTLDSIKKQALPDYEVVVVTNGCTDKTEEIAKKNAGAKVRHLSLAKPNVSVARNAGALNAQGEIVLFLDADTQLAPDSLQKIKEQFTPEYSVATTFAQPDSGKLSYRLALGFKNSYHYLNLYQGCSGALVCRKKDFHHIGGYNPEIIVREHRKLALNLLELGKFKCINTTVTTSMRRYQQWGLFKVAWFWSKKWAQDKSGTLKESKYETVR